MVTFMYTKCRPLREDSSEEEARMLITVNATERKYVRALPYGEKKIDMKLRWKHEVNKIIEKSGLYLIFDWITLTIAEIARPVDTSVGRAKASIPSKSLNTFKETTTQKFTRRFMR